MSITRSIYQSFRQWYRRLFQQQEDLRTREAVEVVQQVSLFQGLPRGALRDLAEVVHPRDYKRDEFIYYQHDPGLGLYIVQRGGVRLLAEDDDGMPYELCQVAENGFFGELSLLGDFRRQETAQAITETRVLGFFIPDLKMLTKRNPSVGAAVAMALARHLAIQQVALLQRVADAEGQVDALRFLRGIAPPV